MSIGLFIDGAYVSKIFNGRIDYLTLRTGQACHNVVMGLPRPGGNFTWISVNSEPLFRQQESAPYAAVTSFEDITASRATQSSLRETRDAWMRCRQELQRLKAGEQGH